MSWRSAAAIVVLAVTTGFAQQNTPGSAPAATPAAEASQPLQRPTPMRRRGTSPMGNRQAGPLSGPSLQQRVQDLQGTVDKMNDVLARMRKKAAASAKDSMAKSDLQMWELMFEQLDKQLKDLKQAEASRAEMEARRAAMYKQAEVKSQVAGRDAQQVMFSHQPTGTETTPSAGATAQAPAASPTPAAGPVPGPSSAPSPSSSQN